MFLQPSHRQPSEQPTPAWRAIYEFTLRLLTCRNIKTLKWQARDLRNSRQLPESTRNTFWGKEIFCSYSHACVWPMLEYPEPHPTKPSADTFISHSIRSCQFRWKKDKSLYSETIVRNTDQGTKSSVEHTPGVGEDSAAWTILGANASGLRDSICCLVVRTVSSYSGLLKHSRHAQEPTQYTPAAKHSQYLFNISGQWTRLAPESSH